LNSTVNLIWDSYEGFNVSTYNILRYSGAEGWVTLTSLPSNLTSYTDQNPPIETELFYVVEAVHPDGGCTTLKAGSYNSARSNRQTSSVKSTIGVKPILVQGSVNIYPNPASGSLHLNVVQENLKQVRVDLIDMSGQVLKNFKFNPESSRFDTVLDLGNIPEGVYVLRIGSDDQVNFRKLIIE
jgi:hypothetical protein